MSSMVVTKYRSFVYNETPIKRNKKSETLAELRESKYLPRVVLLNSYVYAHEITSLCEAEMYNQANNFSIYREKILVYWIFIITKRSNFLCCADRLFI